MRILIPAALFAGTFALGTVVPAVEAEGPPPPVPFTPVVDPPIEAQRHIVVKAEDRGPVWLYTGFLGNWHPNMDDKLIDRLAPRHWRHGLWPYWTPPDITANPRPGWGDLRDSPRQLGQFMESMMRLQADGMTWQILLHHKGRYYDRYRITNDMLEDFYDHIYTLVKYCREMGAPFDYYEICNEPGVGPHEGIEGYSFRGTWKEFLEMWDTAHRAIRDAYPEAKIVGPSYGSCSAEMMEPFLAHCQEKGQKLDVLSWHEITQDKVKFGPAYQGANVVEPDKAYQNIMEIRQLVESKYADLGIQQYHIDEWGFTVDKTGPGTQIAYFQYFDLAGIDRAAKAHWTHYDLDGILVGPTTPRTSYWCWAEYARQRGGLRLVTETNDRSVVALASRHKKANEMRVLVARSKRHTGDNFSKKLPPVKTRIELQECPFDGNVEVTTLTLGPDDGPVAEEDLPALTTRTTETVANGTLALTIHQLAENQVVSFRIALPGTWATEAKAADSLAREQLARQQISKGESLPHVVFQEGFEQAFQVRDTAVGNRGWTIGKGDTSALRVFEGAQTAYTGMRYGQFLENYWATNNAYHAVPEQKRGALEVTAWYRFPDYDGNKNGRGLGAALLGLSETADRNVEKNYVSFKFGTHHQNGYSRVIFDNDGARQIQQVDASGLRNDVRGKWYQVSLVLDMDGRRVTARHRPDRTARWKVFYTATYPRIDWVPRYVRIGAYNQAPDWHFCIDQIEVRSSRLAREDP